MHSERRRFRHGLVEVSLDLENDREIRVGFCNGDVSSERLQIIRSNDPSCNEALHGPRVPGWMRGSASTDHTVETVFVVIAMLRSFDVDTIVVSCNVGRRYVAEIAAKAVENEVLPPTVLIADGFREYRKSLVEPALAGLARVVERRREKEARAHARSVSVKAGRKKRGRVARRPKVLPETTVRRIEALAGLAGMPATLIAPFLKVEASRVREVVRIAREEGRLLPRHPKAPLRGTNPAIVERWVSIAAKARESEVEVRQGVADDQGTQSAGADPVRDETVPPPLETDLGLRVGDIRCLSVVSCSEEASLVVTSHRGRAEFQVPDAKGCSEFIRDFEESLLPVLLKGNVRLEVSGAKASRVFRGVIDAAVEADLDSLDLRMSEQIPSTSSS